VLHFQEFLAQPLVVVVVVVVVLAVLAVLDVDSVVVLLVVGGSFL